MTDFKVEAEVVPAGESFTTELIHFEPSTHKMNIRRVPTRIHDWKSVKFMMQAPIVIRGMRDPQVSQIVGRAIGDRDDGNPFTIVVEIPWIIPEDYSWQPKAKERLDTFLMDLCQCDSVDNEVRICDWHRSLAGPWAEADHMEIVHMEGGIQGDIPAPKQGPGLELELMHRDFPWARYSRSTNEWVCMMCGMRADAMDNNSTWRNQFIRKHSHCGFVPPSTILPASIEDKVLEELGSRLERQYEETRMMAYDTARAFVLNQRGTLVIKDSRKPKKLRAAKGKVLPK